MSKSPKKPTSFAMAAVRGVLAPFSTQLLMQQHLERMMRRKGISKSIIDEIAVEMALQYEKEMSDAVTFAPKSAMLGLAVNAVRKIDLAHGTTPSSTSYTIPFDPEANLDEFLEFHDDAGPRPFQVNIEHKPGCTCPDFPWNVGDHDAKCPFRIAYAKSE
jgi:hypothetical protein